MGVYLFKKRKSILLLGIFLISIGLLLAYFKRGTEPEETIAGALCGLGFGVSIFSFARKKE